MVFGLFSSKKVRKSSPWRKAPYFINKVIDKIEVKKFARNDNSRNVIWKIFYAKKGNIILLVISKLFQ